MSVVSCTEASRGCGFRCSFCVIPAEVGSHAAYDLSWIAATIDSAIATSSTVSFRRRYLIVLFIEPCTPPSLSLSLCQPRPIETRL